MKIEIPEKLVDQIRVIDAINSWRANAGEKDLEKYRQRVHVCHMLTQHVADEVMTLILREIEKERR